MVVVVGLAVLLALHVVSPSWGLALIAGAIVFEAGEKGFWWWWTRRIPPAVGAEAMVGRAVIVVAPCRPDGRGRFGRESWKARCIDGASVGEPLVIDAVDRVTLIVRRQGASESVLESTP
jgi:membrane protein implicated in regulation of membrane protease activity